MIVQRQRKMETHEGFAILCDARDGDGIDVLALVDRSVSQDRWWTSDDPSVMLVYRDRKAADCAVRRLRHNNPRVVPASEAQRLLSAQSESRREIEREQLHRWCEQQSGFEWDAHKDWF